MTAGSGINCLNPHALCRDLGAFVLLHAKLLASAVVDSTYAYLNWDEPCLWMGGPIQSWPEYGCY